MTALQVGNEEGGSRKQHLYQYVIIPVPITDCLGVPLAIPEKTYNMKYRVLSCSAAIRRDGRPVRSPAPPRLRRSRAPSGIDRPFCQTRFFAPAPPARTAANRRPAPPTEEAVLFIYCSRAGVKLFLAASPSGFRLAGSSAKGARPRAQGTGPIQRPSCHCEAENVDLAILRLGMRYCAIRRLTNAGRRSPSKTPSTTPRRARIRRSPTRRCGGTRGCRCRVRASCVPRP